MKAMDGKPAWACVLLIGKKAVASDEWLVARNAYQDSRVLAQTLNPLFLCQSAPKLNGGALAGGVGAGD